MKPINHIYLPVSDIVVPKGFVRLDWHNVVTDERKTEFIRNMVVNTGKYAMAAAFFDATRGNITHCAVGTGLTAPDAGDIKLQTELARKLISVRSSALKVFTAQTFFNTSEAVGTLKEAGLFGDGATLTPDSGVLFCRLAINRVKSSNDTLTLSWDVTVG